MKPAVILIPAKPDVPAELIPALTAAAVQENVVLLVPNPNPNRILRQAARIQPTKAALTAAHLIALVVPPAKPVTPLRMMTMKRIPRLSTPAPAYPARPASAALTAAQAVQLLQAAVRPYVLRVNPIPVPVFPAVHALAALTEAVFAIPVITAITAIV